MTLMEVHHEITDLFKERARGNEEKWRGELRSLFAEGKLAKYSKDFYLSILRDVEEGRG